MKKNSGITPNPSGHRPQRPCAQGQTCAEREGSAKQARTGAGGCTPQMTPKQERWDRSPSLHLHAKRGMAAQGGSKVEEVRDKTSRGSCIVDTVGRKRHEQHHLGVIGSRTRAEEVMLEKGNCHRAAQARGTREFKQQAFNVAPYMFLGRLSPRSRSIILTRGEDGVLAETTRGVHRNGSFSKGKKMIPGQT